MRDRKSNGRRAVSAWGRLALAALCLGLMLATAFGCVPGRTNAAAGAVPAEVTEGRNPVHDQAYLAARANAATAAGAACPSAAPGTVALAGPEAAGTVLVFSDVHFDPFADPALVKTLAAAPAKEWRGILAGSGSGLSPYGQDSNDALFQSFLDDMAARVPRPDFLLFPGDLLCHRFQASYVRATGDRSRAGLAAFTQKTVHYFLAEVTRRFPGVPLYVALGNNDSLEGDYRIMPESPYLAATADLTARLAFPDEAGRTAFLATYPQNGCYAVTVPGTGGLRLVVINDILWSPKSPDPDHGAAVLDFLARELEAARQAGRKVWVMTHIPPGDNVHATLRKSQGTGAPAYQPLLVDSRNDAFVGLLTAYGPTIKGSFAGHVHRDDFRLLPGGAGAAPAGLVRLAPSISPVTGNNPGYQVYAYDRASLELLDVTTYVLDLVTPRPAWRLEYVYSATYGFGLRGPADWRGVFEGLSSCPPRRQDYEASYNLRAPNDTATEATFPVFRRAIMSPTRQAFEAWPAQ